MTSIVIVGTQWGDEGKGKITDVLACKANCVARFSGGNNAGHTIQFAGKNYKLHLVPSGIFFEDKISIIGNGCVIDVEALLNELSYLEKEGVSTNNLRISNRAHLILPYHIKLDILEEQSRRDNKIGTTKKGIGPAMTDKVSRAGIRMADLLNKKMFAEKLTYALFEKNRLLEKVYDHQPFSFADIFEKYYDYGQKLAPFVCDTSMLINKLYSSNKNILFEGAQGTMLDVDHGTYPYVTSSNPTTGGVITGLGFSPKNIDYILGVSKSYSTRVGEGPFPTELLCNTGQVIRQKGNEFGTTTGRPRRIGWLDTVVLRHAKRVNGITNLVLNCLDVFTGIPKIKLCTSYKLNGKVINEYPADLQTLAKCEPIYEELDGWNTDITNIDSYDQLPTNVKKYIERVEELAEAKISIVSVGPDRKQTIILDTLY